VGQKVNYTRKTGQYLNREFTGEIIRTDDYRGFGSDQPTAFSLTIGFGYAQPTAALDSRLQITNSQLTVGFAQPPAAHFS